MCVPGTTTCQTIDHVQVDTGSFGLRLLASQLTLSLPVIPRRAAPRSSNAPLSSMAIVGVPWRGWMSDFRRVRLSVPVHLIGDNRFPASTVPSDCSGSVRPGRRHGGSIRRQRPLGRRSNRQDCGSACVNAHADTRPTIPVPARLYGHHVQLASQVQNPVTMFATDNNGTIIDLRRCAASGAASVGVADIRHRYGVEQRAGSQPSSPLNRWDLWTSRRCSTVRP